MRLLLTLLIVANIALAAWYTVRKCWSRQGIEFNHVLAFTVGFLFYWICPVALGVWRFFDEMPAMSVWYGIFDGIGMRNWPHIFRFRCWLTCPLCSERSGAKAAAQDGGTRPETYPQYQADERLPGAGGGMFVPAAIGIRSEFFKGYTNIRGVQDLYSRSQFGAVTVFSILLWMLYSSMHHQKLNLAAATYGCSLTVFWRSTRSRPSWPFRWAQGTSNFLARSCLRPTAPSTSGDGRPARWARFWRCFWSLRLPSGGPDGSQRDQVPGGDRV